MKISPVRVIPKEMPIPTLLLPDVLSFDDCLTMYTTSERGAELSEPSLPLGVFRLGESSLPCFVFRRGSRRVGEGRLGSRRVGEGGELMCDERSGLPDSCVSEPCEVARLFENWVELCEVARLFGLVSLDPVPPLLLHSRSSSDSLSTFGALLGSNLSPA